MNRQQLRQHMRQARRALSPQQQRSASLKLSRQFHRLPGFSKAQRIALYLAADGEISPDILLKTLSRQGKRVYLPVLHPVRHNRLWFVRYQPGMPMQRNRFAISEPNPRFGKRIPIWGLDLLLLPLVAFDPFGGRLGMGGGFYDRTLAYRQRLQPFHRPRLVGLAHELQKVERLEIASWDIPLDGVLTDQNYYRC